MGLTTFYPPIEPHDSGMLDVGDGDLLYWEVSGNPCGKPAVLVHGGPGAGTSPLHRRVFDPAAYRIVLFDQRNCGRSIPHASEPEIDLSANTTANLVADMERLREHLGVDRWLVFGGSWGSTLALAYTEAHPSRVTELVVRGVYLVQESDEPWCYAEGGVSRLFPDAWERFVAPIPEDERGDLMAAYARRLASPDPAVHGPAALAWTHWEDSAGALLPRPLDGDVRAALAVARLESRYFGAGCFLEPGQLLRDAGRLAGVPGVIVNGRYDLLTPPDAAWALHEAWPGSELHLVPDAGHAFDEPGTLHLLIGATDRFRPWTE
ncbi:prolyl aminopeptidase [Actinomadura parmotrematis]|uniref:Proline iminopeptidase n=1 Tax=Actinomadura parmotrematis TaxID=2864039 RepID=A0ABS7FL90_9ACTN|nr:prolyl aminopeptidase [Actinomadura parmotrematis]MBW8481147.1 prolyl aminopeptidase [Actinomadura parmotrematis]